MTAKRWPRRSAPRSCERAPHFCRRCSSAAPERRSGAAANKQSRKERPFKRLNRAVAVAMLEGIESGMLLLDRLAETGELDVYYLFHAARADLLRRSGKVDEAHSAYIRAFGLCQNNTEHSFLRRRLAEINGQTRR